MPLKLLCGIHRSNNKRSKGWSDSAHGECVTINRKPRKPSGSHPKANRKPNRRTRAIRPGAGPESPRKPESHQSHCRFPDVLSIIDYPVKLEEYPVMPSPHRAFLWAARRTKKSTRTRLMQTDRLEPSRIPSYASP